MGVMRSLKVMVEKLTGIYIYRVPPFGVSIANDISQKFPDYRLSTIFDVGANVGQSALEYISTYPLSKIYCFEPIAASYEQLISNTKETQRVRAFNLALGDSAGEATMISEGVSTMNCLVSEKSRDDNEKLQKTERVEILTLDDFCKSNNISTISYLKIDTEGGDLNVLRGAKNILSTNGIDFVEVEAGMNPNNKHHVPFENLKSFLEDLDYYIFGIYEQVNEWPEGRPNLRRSNTVYVSKKMINKYTAK